MAKKSKKKQKNKETVRSGWQEVLGLVLLAIGVLLFFSLLSYDANDIPYNQDPPNDPAANMIGPVGAWFGFVVFMLFGVVGYLVPVGLSVLGPVMILKREGRVWPKAVWMCLIWFSLICLVNLNPALWENRAVALNTFSGGLLGEYLASGLLIGLLGKVGTGILAGVLLIISISFFCETDLKSIPGYIARVYGSLSEYCKKYLNARRDRQEQIEYEKRELEKKQRKLEKNLRALEARKRKSKPDKKTPADPAAKIAPVKPPKKPKPNLPADKALTTVSDGTYQLPPMDLLNPVKPQKQRTAKIDFEKSGNILVETLEEFGIDTELTDVAQGPVVTRYELRPAPGVRVERIASLSNNIALAMKAEAVRVQAPIPGKGVVGIEVPNASTTMVTLRESMESERWLTNKAALPLVLGKDVSGRDIVADLAAMPHLLIAGATGSGKTVCMNSLLAGLLMSRTPDELRMMLVDPKIVEFSIYNKLPHLVVPVITDPKKVALGLRWAIDEMEKRYKVFAQVGVRNIKAFNERPIQKQPSEAADDSCPPDRLPYIVVVVDELADLMMVAQADVENSIARLAQLSRAVGIHMIIATQRPSVNVITGTIKANFPARIAFQVAQKVDSRTILDANGADKLLGKGDMLFLPPGSSKLVRAQGTLTADEEIRSIVDFITAQATAQYEVSIKERIENNRPEVPEVNESDDLLETAIEIIRQTQRASTSSLQRRLRIGYTRAARLMDILEERGIVGPPRGSDPREILIDLDGDIPSNEDEFVMGEE